MCSFSIHYGLVKDNMYPLWYRIPLWMKQSPDFLILTYAHHSHHSHHMTTATLPPPQTAPHHSTSHPIQGGSHRKSQNEKNLAGVEGAAAVPGTVSLPVPLPSPSPSSVLSPFLLTTFYGCLCCTSVVMRFAVRVCHVLWCGV